MSRRFWTYFFLVIVVVAIAIYIVAPNSPGIHLGSVNKDFITQLGLDLVGGAQALLEADLPEGAVVDQEAMGTAATVVENRINGLGVTESVVQQAGDRRIVVELPGETDPERVLATLQQTGVLEFVDLSELTPADYPLLEDGVTINTDFGLSAGNIITPTAGLTVTAATPDNPFPDRNFHTVMTGTDLNAVQVSTDQTGNFVIEFELSSEGAKIFREYTGSHLGSILAIVLDKKLISAPTVQNEIPDGRGIIQGNFTYESANALAIQLRYGSLPIPLKVVNVRTVGPTLGQDSLQKSLLAGAIGFSIVMLFMALYYRLPGLMADISIVIYALLAFAIFRFVPITLTLPGIAGFILSTGSALDANILIFERIKEELRAGKNLRQAVDLGWRRAWPSIRDSNIATLITCGILFWFGSAFGATIVKGFSVTLALGVMVSVFCALVVTRLLMEIVVKFFKSKNFARWFGI
jgi:preprotein translocase subunit SecD